MSAPNITVDTFAVAYQLGYGAGYEVGFAHGADDAYERVQATITGCASAWRSPRQDHLRAVRDEVITSPCRQRCQRCSRCIRYAAWWRNGRCDYKGVHNMDTPNVNSGNLDVAS